MTQRLNDIVAPCPTFLLTVWQSCDVCGISVRDVADRKRK